MKKEDNEQRAMVAILLSLGVYWAWSAFFAPKAPPPEDPAAQAATQPQATGGGAPSLGVAPDAVVAAVPERVASVSTGAAAGKLSSSGPGGLADVTLPGAEGPIHITPVWTWVVEKVTGKADGGWVPYGGPPEDERLLSEKGQLLSAGAGPLGAPSTWRVEGDGPWTLTNTSPVQVSQTWRSTDDPHLMEVELRFVNTGTAPWTGPLWIGAQDQFTGEAGQYANVTRPAAVVDGDLETLEDLEDAGDTFEGPVGWIGVADSYYVAAVMPDNPEWGTVGFAAVGQEQHGVFLSREASLAPGASEALKAKVYVGPKDISTLGEYGDALEEAVDLGFFGFFARILLMVLEALHGVIGNWGAAIVVLTLTVKLAFWPLNRAAAVSGRKMQSLSPKVAELKEKYKDDPAKQGEEQMKLFQQEGVNPMSGCLPMLVQMPVWLAMFTVLQKSQDIYQQSFLYIQDLSAADPYGVLPTLVGIFMILQQRMMPMSPGMDPTQQKMMRLMPFFFVLLYYSFPSGLALYTLVNTIFTIGQTWWVNRTIPVPQTAET